MLLTNADRIDPYRLTRAEADLLDDITIALSSEQRSRLLAIVDKAENREFADRIVHRLRHPRRSFPAPILLILSPDETEELEVLLALSIKQARHDNTLYDLLDLVQASSYDFD